MNTVKAIPSNYNITETPYSIYLILRKSLLKSTEGFEGQQVVNQDLKIRRLEETNPNLSADLDEAVNKCKEKARTIAELKETVKNLFDKLTTVKIIA